jgi:hypothetical protein
VERLEHLDGDGPTWFASARSAGARREAWTLICRASTVPPSITTLNAASAMWRFGYSPMAAAKYSRVSRGVAVEEVAVVVVQVGRCGVGDRL